MLIVIATADGEALGVEADSMATTDAGGLVLITRGVAVFAVPPGSWVRAYRADCEWSRRGPNGELF